MSRSPRVGKCRYSVARRRPAPGAANPVGHHVTNTVLTLTADGTVTAGSTFLGVRGDGTVASGVYEDTVGSAPRPAGASATASSAPAAPRWSAVSRVWRVD